MAVEKLIDIIINHLKGLSEHPEALAYITDVDRKKYRTEVMRYVGTMTGLSQHTLETRLAGQSRFKALEILSLKRGLSLSWGDVQAIFEPENIVKLMQLEQAHERIDADAAAATTNKEGAG